MPALVHWCCESHLELSLFQKVICENLSGFYHILSSVLSGFLTKPTFFNQTEKGLRIGQRCI